MNEAYAHALAQRPVLRTARLLLRTPVEADIPAIVAICGDREVAQRLGRIPHPYSATDARFFLAGIVPAELAWAMVERATDKVVGMAGLSPGRDGTIELGYYVARDQWGRGIATEAGAVVAAFGAGLVGQHRLRSSYFVDNPASGRVLEKLGFTAVARSERPCLALSGPRPCVEMGFAGAKGSSLQSAAEPL